MPKGIIESPAPDAPWEMQLKTISPMMTSYLQPASATMMRQMHGTRQPGSAGIVLHEGVLLDQPQSLPISDSSHPYSQIAVANLRKKFLEMSSLASISSAAQPQITCEVAVAKAAPPLMKPFCKLCEIRNKVPYFSPQA